MRASVRTGLVGATVMLVAALLPLAGGDPGSAGDPTTGAPAGHSAASQTAASHTVTDPSTTGSDRGATTPADSASPGDVPPPTGGDLMDSYPPPGDTADLGSAGTVRSESRTPVIEGGARSVEPERSVVYPAAPDGQLVAEVHSTAPTAEIVALVEQAGGTVTGSIDGWLVQADLTPEAIDVIAADPRVDFVAPPTRVDGSLDSGLDAVAAADEQPSARSPGILPGEWHEPRAPATGAVGSELTGGSQPGGAATTSAGAPDPAGGGGAGSLADTNLADTNLGAPVGSSDLLVEHTALFAGRTDEVARGADLFAAAAGASPADTATTVAADGADHADGADQAGDAGQVAGRGVWGEHLDKMLVEPWWMAGLRGQGMRVGIVDSFSGTGWNSAMAAGDLPMPAGSFCRQNGATCSVWDGGSDHGTAVAEVVHDTAPNAQLYVASARSAADLQQVVNWFQANNVRIVTRSLTAEFDGPGNGTGPLAAVVNDAVSKNMLFLNSAGNNAGGGYWRGPWVDANNNGWLDFAPGQEFLGFQCGFVNGVRWNDWGSPNPTDYDVFVYDQFGNEVASSTRTQAGGANPPLELNNGISCANGQVLFLRIGLWAANDGTSGDMIEFMMNNRTMQFHTDPRSASGPVADTANPGAMAVGAIDPPLGTAIAEYSSRGPSQDGRIKPDISGAACLTNHSLQPCFDGTSSSTPAVAGLATLVRQLDPAATPAQVATFLKNHAADRGPAGPDNTFGVGEARLPLPWSPTFGDVPGAHPFFNEVSWLVAAKITEGYPDNTYRPGAAVSRQAMAAFLYRLVGSPGGTFPNPGFNDVPTSHPFYKEIAWMAQAGIAGGFPDGTFRPGAPVARQSMAAFLHRLVGEPPGPFPNPGYTDVSGSHPFALQIRWMASTGISGGFPDNTFRPGSDVTRQSMAAFLYRLVAQQFTP